MGYFSQYSISEHPCPQPFQISQTHTVDNQILSLLKISKTACCIWWHFEKMRCWLGLLCIAHIRHQQLTYKTLSLFVLLSGKGNISSQRNWANVFSEWLDMTKCNRPKCQIPLSLYFICSAFHAPLISSHAKKLSNHLMPCYILSYMWHE